MPVMSLFRVPRDAARLPRSPITPNPPPRQTNAPSRTPITPSPPHAGSCEPLAGHRHQPAPRGLPREPATTPMPRSTATRGRRLNLVESQPTGPGVDGPMWAERPALPRRRPRARPCARPGRRLRRVRPLAAGRYPPPAAGVTAKRPAPAASPCAQAVRPSPLRRLTCHGRSLQGPDAARSAARRTRCPPMSGRTWGGHGADIL